MIQATENEARVEKALAGAITAENDREPTSVSDLARAVFGELGDEFIAGLISTVTLVKMAHREAAGEQASNFLVFLAGAVLAKRLGEL